MANQDLIIPDAQPEITDEMVRKAEEILRLRQLQEFRKADPVAKWYEHLDQEVTSKNLSEDTVKNYIRGLQLFQSWGKEFLDPGDSYTPKIIKKWISHLYTKKKAGGGKLNTQSVALWLAGVRAFFKFARFEGYVPFDPTEGVKAGKNLTSRIYKRESLEEKEAQALLSLNNLNLRDKAIIALSLYTGCRQIELHRADIEDLQWKKGRRILKIQGKGQREKIDQLVIVSESARDAIQSYVDELKTRGHKSGPLFVTERKYDNEYRRISRRTLARAIKEAFKKAGIKDPNKTAHSMRHLVMDTILKNSNDIRIVKKVARHKSQATTEAYLHDKDRFENPGEAFIEYGIEGE